LVQPSQFFGEGEVASLSQTPKVASKAVTPARRQSSPKSDQAMATKNDPALFILALDLSTSVEF
jgi:hypothetical protein